MNHLNDIKALADLVMGDKPECNMKDKPMREIKFRIWSDISGRMLMPQEMERQSVFALQEGLEPEDFIVLPLSESYNLMQYTGLKDKNGKEIYEGDIVKDEYYRDNGWKDWKIESKGFVKFFNGVFCLIDPTDLDSEKMYDILYQRMNPSDTKAVSSVEVIGNIHENSELLK